MVGKESESYRPRRAQPNDPGTTDPTQQSEDSKPLFRDDQPTEGRGSQSLGSADTHRLADVGEHAEAQPASGPGTSASRAEDDDATTILPKTQRRTAEPGSIDDRPTGNRTRTALLVGAVAAVVVLGLAIGYSIFSLSSPKAADPGTNESPSGSISASGSTSPSVEASVLLTDDSMLNAKEAKAVSDKRTWKVALTQKGLDANSPQPACLGGDPAEGQPTPQQTVLRLLSSSGKDGPGILHQADAYNTEEEAAQAFALTSKALGGCTMAATYIDSGQVVSGVGDQSLGLVLQVQDAAAPEFRSVILSRTGRIVNVVDVAQKNKVVSQRGVMAALAAVTNVQCTTSGGKCAENPDFRDGPPPVGGDQPGFLATGDLPPVGEPAATWVGDAPSQPNPDFTGSGCETTRFHRVKAKSASARTYLLDGTGGVFGLDEIVLTLDSSKAAKSLASDLLADMNSCKARKLTATVTKPKQVTGNAAKRAKITGWTATVTQSTSATAKSTYRVGVSTVGPKLTYVFLSADVDKKLDVTDKEWDRVTIRAAQRASQVN
jgi:hypothetical protein